MKVKNILTIFILLIVSNAHSQTLSVVDTVFIKDSVYYCKDGLILQPGKLPDPSLQKYKCYLSKYKNLIVIIREEDKFANISFYKKEFIECYDQNIISWDELPINFKIPLSIYEESTFLDDIMLQEKTEAVIVYH